MLEACSKVSAELSVDEKLNLVVQVAVTCILKNPRSAIFSDVLVRGTFCGKVNAKKSFGHSLGFRLFGWSRAVGATAADSDR